VLGVDPASLPADRGAAATALDAAGAGNWRTLLERYTAERAPVYLRPNAEASAALRRLAASGRPVGVFTDAPAELADTALAQLGALRRIDDTASGSGALEALRERLGSDAVIVATRAELTALAALAIG
jgi:phosphoglycolate phosphatase-like HAD superfamily hydrolase